MKGAELMWGRKAVAMLLIIGALGVVAGCGGSDDGSGTSSAPLTKAAFIKRADALCLKAGETAVEGLKGRAEEAQKAGKSLNKVEEGEAIRDVVVPALETEFEGIAALGPPEGDEAEVEAMIESLEKGIAEMEADPTEQSGGQVNALKDFEARTEAYGLNAC